ncbi:hypothetical protein AA313_de0208206 [Arthrobotrys entomopaga]|nr:hypothetical protein AA313_de0208206 [Arthrobotrys entomopaga]
MDKPSSSSPSSGGSGGKPVLHAQTVFKFVAFQDTTSNIGAKIKGQGERVKSWQEDQVTDAWFDQAMVDREIKNNPVGSYIQSYLDMGKIRKEILDNYMKMLNETEKPDATTGPWEPVHLFPGNWVVEKKNGVAVKRPPGVFWVIIKKMKKVQQKSDEKLPASSSSASSAVAIKGVLKDDKKDVKKDDKRDTKKDDKKDDKKDEKKDEKKDLYGSLPGSKASNIKSAEDPLVQQLLSAITKINTSNNGPDMQMQLQQLQLQLAALVQSQRNQQTPQMIMHHHQQQNPHMQMHQQTPQQMPMQMYPNFNQNPYQMQVQTLPYQDQGLPLNARLPLPQAPLPPNSYHQYPPSRGSPDNPPIQINSPYSQPGFNSHTIYSLPNGSSSRMRIPYDDEEDYNSHLNSMEPQNYPRGGTGSRRHSISSSSYNHNMRFQDDLPHHINHGGNNGMYHQDMRHMQPSCGQQQQQHLIGNHPHHHPHLEPGKVKLLESWQQEVSSNSERGSEDDFRGRSESRNDSIYMPGHLLNSRSRSGPRTGFADLSAPNGRRNSVSFGGGGMGDPRYSGNVMGLGKGFGMSNAASDDEMSMGHHDRRLMSHHMGGIPDRSMSKTPGPWPQQR